MAEAAQAAEDSAGEQRTTAAAAAAQGAEAARSRTPAWRVTPPAGEQAAGEQPDTVGSSSAARHARSDRADTVVTGGPMPTDEAIDLLGTAGTPVLKRVLPAVAVLAAGALLFRWLRRRKHRR